MAIPDQVANVILLGDSDDGRTYLNTITGATSTTLDTQLSTILRLGFTTAAFEYLASLVDDDSDFRSPEKPIETVYVPGLPAFIRNRGLQVLNDRPCNYSAAAANVLTTQYSSARNGVTTRMRQRALFDATHIVLAYANWCNDNSTAEGPNRNNLVIRAALQKYQTDYATETGATIPATFNGQKYGYLNGDSVLLSDPISFDVAKNDIFFVRTVVHVPGPTHYVPGPYRGMGGTGSGCIENGDAVDREDRLEGLTLTHVTAPGCYGPLTVLAYSPEVKKTVGILGDSIAGGTGDEGSYRNHGGYLSRVMKNQTDFLMTTANHDSYIAHFPHVWTARGGYSLANYADRELIYKEMRVLEYVSTVISNLGTNDHPGDSLANMKANLLTIAGYFKSRGIKFIQTTLTPYTTSTDNWATVGNQTAVASESKRVGYNDWLRDTTSTGFVAQAGGPSVAAVWDISLSCEVNSAGVYTRNGGFWPAATSASDYTGSITSGASTTSWTDSALSGTKDTYRGRAVEITSGAADGLLRIISAESTTKVLSFDTAFGSSPANTDTYKIFRPWTIDGIHPSTEGHYRIANYLNTDAFLEMIV